MSNSIETINNMTDDLSRIDAIDNAKLVSYVKKTASAEADFALYCQAWIEAKVPASMMPESYSATHPACGHFLEGYRSGLTKSSQRLLDLPSSERSKDKHPTVYKEYSTLMQTIRRCWGNVRNTVHPPVASTSGAQLKGDKTTYTEWEKLASGIEGLKRLFTPTDGDESQAQITICMHLQKALDCIVADVGTDALKKAIAQVESNKLKGSISCSKPKAKS